MYWTQTKIFFSLGLRNASLLRPRALLALSGARSTLTRTLLVTLLGLVASVPRAAAQGTVKLEINMGQERPRMAASEFKQATSDPQSAPLATVFNETLWSDLDNAGIFEMVAKSFYPSAQ